MAKSRSETMNVEPRTTGKHNSRIARNERLVPGVIYGPKNENLNILCTELFIQKHRSPKFESVIFKTESNKTELKGINVMLKKIQYHPVSNRPVHVDLYALDMSEKIKVNIPVKYIGEPIGCKEEGGLRQIILHEIEIECAPDDIPETIDVDVTHLKLGDSIHVFDLTFADNLKVMTASDRTLVTVNLPKEEKAEVSTATAAPTEGAEAAPAAAGAGDKKAAEKK